MAICASCVVRLTAVIAQLVNSLHTLNRGEATLLIMLRDDYGHTALELAQCLPGREHITTMLQHLVASMRGKDETDEDLVRHAGLPSLFSYHD
jgi:hypothetical protein